MSSNIYPQSPTGKLGEVKVGYIPAKLALAATNKENTTNSSVIALTHDTTELEVHAVTVGVAGKWATNQATSVVTGAAGTENWDFLIPAGEVRRFVVPIQTNTQTDGSIMGVNRKYGLYQNVAFKSIAGAGSVLVAEY